MALGSSGEGICVYPRVSVCTCIDGLHPRVSVCACIDGLDLQEAICVCLLVRQAICVYLHVCNYMYGRQSACAYLFGGNPRVTTCTGGNLRVSTCFLTLTYKFIHLSLSLFLSFSLPVSLHLLLCHIALIFLSLHQFVSFTRCCECGVSFGSHCSHSFCRLTLAL